MIGSLSGLTFRIKEVAPEVRGHRRSQVAKGVIPPTFLENIVILCFERRFSKQNSVISLKSNVLPRQKFLGWLCHCARPLIVLFTGKCWRAEKYHLSFIVYSMHNRRQKVVNRGAWHSNLMKILLIYNVSYSSLGGLELCLGG